MMPAPGQQPLIKVHLYGALADRFGSQHEFAIRTPREAVRALDANFPGFMREFYKVERYAVIADDEGRDSDAAAHLTVTRELHLIPKIEGEAFAGAALITAIFPAITGIAATVLGGLLVTGVLFGLSMLLRPKKSDEEKKEAAKDESYAFTGPENVTTQGAAVPLIYGRVYAGSVVISAGLSVADVAIT